MNIGFSTGSLALGNFNLALNYVKNNKKINSIEISSLRENELDNLIDQINDLNLNQFKHISIHAPSKLEKLSEEVLISKLEVFTNRKLHVIVHPDIISNYNKWNILGEYLCIENMDKRKGIGRTTESLREIFGKLPKAKFCFDIAHAQQVDPTMREAAQMIRNFRNILFQIHISSVNSQSRHEPLNLESIFSFKKISHSISNEIPIIIESPLSLDEINLEINKVELVFNDNEFEKYITTVGSSFSSYYHHYSRNNSA